MRAFGKVEFHDARMVHSFEYSTFDFNALTESTRFHLVVGILKRISIFL
jgi:hypothetical protein